MMIKCFAITSDSTWCVFSRKNMTETSLKKRKGYWTGAYMPRKMHKYYDQEYFYICESHAHLYPERLAPQKILVLCD